MDDLTMEYIKFKEIKTSYQILREDMIGKHNEVISNIDEKIAEIDARMSEIAHIVNMNAFPSISNQFENIKEQMCDEYCKMPFVYCSKYKDVNEAHEMMMKEVCEGCPLERL